MTQGKPAPSEIRTFEDLSKVSDEVLRQVAMRIHVIDLAYAFVGADALLERLLASVRPELAEEIRSGIRAANWASERGSSDDQARTARSRVMEAVKDELSR
jgi:hypothetical protein